MKLKNKLLIGMAAIGLSTATSSYGQNGVYTGMLQPNFGSLTFLTTGSDGKLYGIGTSGGVSNTAVFYRVDPATTNSQILFNFPSNAVFTTLNGLARVGTTYYGATFDGGPGTNNNGILFTIQEDGSGYNPFYLFPGRYLNEVVSTPLVMSNGDVITVSYDRTGTNKLAVDRITTNGTVVFSTGTNQFLGIDFNVALVSWHNNVYAKWLGGIYQIDPSSGAISVVYNNTNSYKYIEDIGVAGNDLIDRLWAVNEQSLLYFTPGSWVPVIVNTNKDGAGNFTSPNIPVIGWDGAAYSSVTDGGDGVGSIHRIGTNGIDTEMFRINVNYETTIAWPGKLISAGDGCFYDLTIQSYTTDGQFPHALNTPLITRYWNYQPTAISGGDIDQTNGSRTIKWSSVRGQQYMLLARTNLTLGSWIDVSPILTATNGTTSYTYSPTNIWRPTLFYGVNASNGIPSTYAGIFRSNTSYNVPGLPAKLTVESPPGMVYTNSGGGPGTNNTPPPPTP